MGGSSNNSGSSNPAPAPKPKPKPQPKPEPKPEPKPKPEPEPGGGVTPTEEQLAQIRAQQGGKGSDKPSTPPGEPTPPPYQNSNPQLPGRPQPGSNVPSTYLDQRNMWAERRPMNMVNRQQQSQPMFDSKQRFQGGNRNAQQAQQGYQRMNQGGGFRYSPTTRPRSYQQQPNVYAPMAGPGPNTNLPYDGKPKTPEGQGGNTDYYSGGKGTSPSQQNPPRNQSSYYNGQKINLGGPGYQKT